MTERRLVFLLAALALLAYLPTWTPLVTWAHSGEDGPELETAGRLLGVPHPTGYPLFMLLVRTAGAVVPPPVSAANLVSLIGAVLAVAGAGAAGRNLARRTGIGEPAAAGAAFTAAALFATSLTWWRQASIGEVYTLHLAIVAWVLAAVLAGRGILAAYLLGLGLAHHLQILPFALVLGLYLVLRRARLRWRAVPALLAPATLYAVVVIRSRIEPRLDWGNAETLGGLRWMLAGTPYRGNLLGDGLSVTLDRFGTALLASPVTQLGWGGAALALAGAAVLARRGRAEAVLLGALYAGTVLVAAAYAIPDPAAYHLPAILALALAGGTGTGALIVLAGRCRGRGARLVLRAGLCALVAGILGERVTGVGPRAGARGDLAGFEYALAGARVVEPDALVVSHGDGRTFSLWYGTEVLEPRRDVAVIYDNLLDWSWYRLQVERNHPRVVIPPADLSRGRKRIALVDRHIDGRPVYLTEVDPELEIRYRIEPAGPLFRVRRRHLAGGRAAPPTGAASSERTDREGPRPAG